MIKKTIKQNKTKKKRKILLPIISMLLSFVVIFGLSGSAIAVLIVNDMVAMAPPLNVNDFISPDSTKIYDKDGNLIADIGYHLRENVTYEQMPQSLVDAFVSVEDSRFFTHNGFDIPRFAKSVIENIQTDFGGAGGSTFTMQLVKNTYFVTETSLAPRSLDRKIQEIALAIELENYLSKKRILELYVNKVNFGVPNSLGIQTAAQYYFGKRVEDLNLSESAFLAGVINAPNLNNPYRFLENGTKRRNLVLDLMLRHGYISAEENRLAKLIKLEDLLVGTQVTTGIGKPNQSYIDVVVAEVVRLTGKDPYTIPMNIYTHMDLEQQSNIEAIQNEQTNVKFVNDLIQMGAVSINHRTGQVVAVSGGRNYQGERVWNRATDTINQMGSSIKPLLSYALAFEYLGWSTSHVVLDEPMVYRGTDLLINNFDRTYRGDMRLVDAHARSTNIPAIKTLQQVADTIGVRRVVAYLNSLGFNRVTTANFSLGYAIGGGTFEVSPMELAGGYAALFNLGVYIQPHTVSRIEFKDGSDPIIPTYAEVRVLSAEAAYLSLQLMEAAVGPEYANYMQILRRDYPIYAKTGTTDWGDEGVRYGIPEGAAKEYWIVAGNDTYVNTLWVGFDEAVRGQTTWLTSEIANLNLRGNIMKLILDKQEQVNNRPFAAIPRPEGITSITHILGSFPYAEVLEDMNENLITSGLIKEEFAQLGSLSVPSPASLEDFRVNVDNFGFQATLYINFDDYPDPSQLEIAPNTRYMSVQLPERLVEATGARLFDPSWIYGPIRYITRINYNGNTLVDAWAKDQMQVNIDLVFGQNTIEVCGFYAYEYNLDIRSNTVCKEINLYP